jgi:hypothetical protein
MEAEWEAKATRKMSVTSALHVRRHILPAGTQEASGRGKRNA